MEIDKILSVTLIILAIPVTISVVVLLARLLKVIFFHGEVNLEESRTACYQCNFQ